MRLFGNNVFKSQCRYVNIPFGIYGIMEIKVIKGDITKLEVGGDCGFGQSGSSRRVWR